MFSLKSVGHFFATVAHDLKAGVAFLEAHKTQINHGLQEGAAIATALDPQAAALISLVERGSEFIFGETLSAAEATIAAIDSPLTVTYAVEARKAITDLLGQIKNYKGAIPAGLPNTQAAK